MALRYVARRVGTPALRWAPAPRLSPPAGSGPLASRSSHVGYSNGVGKARKMGNIEQSSAGKGKVPRHEIFEALGEIKESKIAMREAIKRARKREKIYLTSAVLIVGGTLSCIVQDDIMRQMEIKKLLSDE